MFKSAGLLLVVGLAVGLWLGFNPQAHQQVVQGWEQVRAVYLHVKSGAAVQIQQVGLNAGSKVETGNRTQPAAAPSTSVSWNRITATFRAFEDSIRTAWINITARIGRIKL